MNEDLANEIIAFAERQGCNFYGDYNLTVVTTQAHFNNLDYEIQMDLLSSLAGGVGAIATTANGETTTQIFLYPQNPDTDLDKVLFTKHLLHELRHHIQRAELRNYYLEFQNDYMEYIEKGNIREDHWCEIDADKFSLDFIVNHQEELSNILNVEREFINQVETIDGEDADFAQKRQEYQRLREAE